MTTELLERLVDVVGEWNHSCTPQCPNPCPASGALDESLAPQMVKGEG